MKFGLLTIGALLIASSQLPSVASAQEPESEQPPQELSSGNGQARQLTVEEQLKIRAAQQKAAEDPAVQAALAKRNEAIAAFRMAMRNSIIKADPKMQAILDKIAVGNSPGF